MLQTIKQCCIRTWSRMFSLLFFVEKPALTVTSQNRIPNGFLVQKSTCKDEQPSRPLYLETLSTVSSRAIAFFCSNAIVTINLILFLLFLVFKHYFLINVGKLQFYIDCRRTLVRVVGPKTFRKKCFCLILAQNSFRKPLYTQLGRGRTNQIRTDVRTPTNTQPPNQIKRKRLYTNG